jgi:hypothetical protein
MLESMLFGGYSMTKRCRHEFETKADYPNDRICRKCQRIITLTDYKTPKSIMTLPLELRRELMAKQAQELADKYPIHLLISPDPTGRYTRTGDKPPVR